VDLGSTQPSTETRNCSNSWGKGGRCLVLTTFMCRLCRNSESLNLLQSSRPVQASIWNVLPLPLPTGLQVSKFVLFPCKREVKLGITVTWHLTLDTRYTWMVSFTLRSSYLNGETFLPHSKEGWVVPWGDLDNCKIKQTLAPAGDGTTVLKLRGPVTNSLCRRHLGLYWRHRLMNNSDPYSATGPD